MAAAAGMAQFAKRLPFDLADTFTGEAKFFANFFQSIAAAILQTEAEAQDTSLTRS